MNILSHQDQKSVAVYGHDAVQNMYEPFFKPPEFTQKWVSEGGPSGQIMMEEISEYSADALGNWFSYQNPTF